jgi:hydrogenase maturation protease
MKIVIIGVGNEYRQDDGVGPVVLQRLRGFDLNAVALADSDGEPASLIELWDGADLAIVVDAVQAHGLPGRIYRLGLHHPAGMQTRAASSHAVSLGEAVRLARVLGRMPQRLLLYGVQTAVVEPGVGLTPAVAAAADQVVTEIADLIDAMPRAEVV